MRRLAISLISFYQRAISPLLPPMCRFTPTCSEYAKMAYEKHGIVRGTWLTVNRLSRCTPFHPGGYDPPPGCGCGAMHADGVTLTEES